MHELRGPVSFIFFFKRLNVYRVVCVVFQLSNASNPTLSHALEVIDGWSTRKEVRKARGPRT